MPSVDILSAIQMLSLAVIPVLFAITLHEVAHGWTARLLGDPTAEDLGRLSLNPLKHLDPVGSVVLPLALTLLSLPAFGWAKPVPVRWSNLRHPRRDMVLVALAGPASNLLMAVFWALLWSQVVKLSMAGDLLGRWLIGMSKIGITFNVLLAVFNIIPIPPLDGGRVLRGALPESLGRRLESLEPYGLILTLGLLVLGVLGMVIGPLVSGLVAVILAVAGP